MNVKSVNVIPTVNYSDWPMTWVFVNVCLRGNVNVIRSKTQVFPLFGMPKNVCYVAAALGSAMKFKGYLI